MCEGIKGNQKQVVVVHVVLFIYFAKTIYTISIKGEKFEAPFPVLSAMQHIITLQLLV